MSSPEEALLAPGRSLAAQIGDGDPVADPAMPPAGLARRAATVDRGLARVVEAVLALTLTADVLIVLANVVSRSFFDHALLWNEEASRLALALMAFVGGAIAYRDGLFPSLQVFVVRLPARWRAIQTALVDEIVLVTALIGLVISIQHVQQQWPTRSLALTISAGWFVMPISIGMALFALFALARLAQMPPRAVLKSALGFVVVGGLLALTRDFWAPESGMAMLWLVIAAGALLLVGGLPIAFVLAFGSFVYLFAPGKLPLVAFSANLQHGSDDFVLLAIPFFILAGLIMDVGGVSTRVIAFARTLVGHIRGGLLQVQIVTMYLFSGISGSETADISAVGSATANSMRKHGYPAGETAAVLASSAAMGITVPPSIAALVLASVSSVSVGALFAAGILPAAVLMVALMVAVALRARKLGTPKEPRASIKEAGIAFTRVLPALGMVVVLLGGILAGVATPTEVSTVAVLYGLVLAVAYRSLTPASYFRTAVQTSALVGMVLFLISAANGFAWMLAVNQVPQRIGAALVDLPGSTWTFLVLSIALVVVMGALCEGIPALLILAPILIPSAVALGIDPVHYGMVLIFSMGIGAFSPPIGVGFLLACAVTGATVEEGMRRYGLYFAALVVGTLVVAFVPWLTLIVPRLVGL